MYTYTYIYIHIHTHKQNCVQDKGWRRLRKCLKLQVIFRKRAIIHRALLRNMDKGWRRLRGCLKLQVIFRKRAIIHRALLGTWIKGGEDSEDALSCRSCSAKEPLIVGFFCGKRSMERRHSMALCHLVRNNGDVARTGLPRIQDFFVCVCVCLGACVCVFVCVYLCLCLSE